MKVIMLDLDGVLNIYGKTITADTVLSSIPCKNFQDLLDQVPDARIVISSFWRHAGIEFVKHLLDKSGIDSKKVIDITGNDASNRGHEIWSWLKDHTEVESFVILDDHDDMGDLVHKLVKTNGFIGLTSDDVKSAIAILNLKNT